MKKMPQLSEKRKAEQQASNKKAKQLAILRYVVKGHPVRHALKLAGIEMKTLVEWMNTDSKFRKRVFDTSAGAPGGSKGQCPACRLSLKKVPVGRLNCPTCNVALSPADRRDDES